MIFRMGELREEKTGGERSQLGMLEKDRGGIFFFP